MDLFLNALKGQVNTLNLVLCLFIVAFLAGWLGRRKFAGVSLALAVLFFLLVSTAYLPRYLVGRMEASYVAFERPAMPNDSSRVVIHVLGGGYIFDERLPSSAQLTVISLGRLTEGLRIANLLPGSTLVFSGWRVSGTESMAGVMKDAAISLGVDSTRIEVFEEPRTTEEETRSFVDRFGTDVRPVVVTDAIHMPRALYFYRQHGIEAQPAPTNYLVREDHRAYRFRWIPSAENLLLMDRVLREWLGRLKGKIA